MQPRWLADDRAAALEGAGYKTQVLEFIDLEHTPKNLLIRAVKKEGTAADAAGRARYADLKTELGLTEIAVDRIVRAEEKSSTE